MDYTELLPPLPERAEFERWAAVNGYALRRDDGNPERYHAWVTNTLWNGWQAGSASARERCARLVETQDTNGDHVGGWFDLLAAKIRA